MKERRLACFVSPVAISIGAVIAVNRMVSVAIGRPIFRAQFIDLATGGQLCVCV